jgi:hypothetical protein
MADRAGAGCNLRGKREKEEKKSENGAHRINKGTPLLRETNVRTILLVETWEDAWT